jgi:hypothetical protein
MPTDRSRSTDFPRYGYTGPAAQQGRVILDRDFNALQGLTAARIAADALDFVGPSGSPDDGFLISLPGSSPPFWSPPEASPPGSPPGSQEDFLIAPGTMYLGGERVCWPGTQRGKTITYSYFDQPDWPLPDQPANAQMELALLDVSEIEVSAVEDPDLLEVALGGPDTTQRLKLLSRVKRFGVTASDCASAWDQAVSAWEQEGLDFDPATMELLPAVKLKVGFTQDASAGDPCDPVATGGYLGADNQLLRVRIVNNAAGTRLVWGYDNASFIYRIKSVSADGTTLTLGSQPPDAFHMPQTGQVVEILTTAAVFAEEPDETDPTGMSTILRVAAEATGELHVLAQPYGPVTQGDPASYIVLTDAIAAASAGSPLPLFLRVWQAELPLDTSGKPVTLADPATSISTGVTVAITVPKGGALPDGAFWQIAGRPATPQGVYPERLLTAPQPPDGPRRWACPLAVIDWKAQSVTDCRNVFDNLVDLTRRKPGCCTVSISPRDVTAGKSLQSLIDRAAAQAEVVTVCLGAGSYSLREPLRLDSRHDGITLESCGGPAVLAAAATARPAVFIDGLVVVNGADSVTLQGLTLHPVLVPLPAKLFEQMLRTAPASEREEAKFLLPHMYSSFGIRAFDAVRLTLDGCKISFPRFAGDVTASGLVAAAVFLQGDCHGLTLQNCTLGSAITPTFNPTARRQFTGAELAAQPQASAAAAPTPAPAPAAPAPAQQDIPANQIKLNTENKVLAAGVAQDRAKPVTMTVSPVLQTTLPAAAQPAAAQPAAAPAAAAATAKPLLENFKVITADASLSVDNALQDVIAERRAKPFADQQRAVIVTTGILAATYGETATKDAAGQTAANDTDAITCTLGDATMSGNWFDNLTFGSFITAGVAGLRVQDNSVSHSTAGFWLAIGLQRALPLPAFLMFEEYLALLLFTNGFPPPEQFLHTTVLAPESRIIKKHRPPSNAVLFVTGNRVQAGITNVNADGIISTVALFMYLQDAVTEDTSVIKTSLIVSANQISGSNPEVPSALLVLPTQQFCTITGNIILNTAKADGQVPSLAVVLAGGDGEAGPVSITGNVLLGESSLQDIQRSANAAARAGWSGYNADPD